MIRVILPTHLWRLAGTHREIQVDVTGTPTLEKILDEIESRYPPLRGTIRDHVTQERRAFVRFFVNGEDWSHQPADTPLPDRITSGQEPLRIVGAMAGG